MFLEFGDQVANDVLIDDGIESIPAFFREGRDGGALESRELAQDVIQIFFLDVEFDTDFAMSFHDRLEKHSDFFEFCALFRIVHCFVVCNETGCGNAKCIEDHQVVCAEAAASFCDFDDGVSETGRFDFGCAPGEIDLSVDAVLFEVTLCHTDCLIRNVVLLTDSLITMLIISVRVLKSLEHWTCVIISLI